MRKTALLTFFLITIMVLSSISGSTLSSTLDDINSGIGNDPSDSGWWDNWMWDRDRNAIDDRLDEKISEGPLTQRTGIFIDYLTAPKQQDVDRLLNFDLEVKYVYNLIETICARNVLITEIEAISKLPGVVMVEYEDEVWGYLDVGSPTVKARPSLEYSPNTVWDMGIFGTDISVAILDSGVDDGPAPAPPPYHMSLDDMDDDILTTDDPKFIAGVDVTKSVYIIDGSYNPDDGVIGHGTHCAGVAVGTGGGSEFIGVAPQSRLVDVKVMENWGSGVMGEVIRGIEWVVEHQDEFNIRVMSMSIGANYNSDGNDAASQAVNTAVDSGLIAVVAAGNGGSNTIGPPAAADKALVVGALNDHNTIDRSDDNVWGSSNVGPRADDGDADHSDEMKPDVLAPGVNIMSAKSDTTGTNIQFSGTSMATPHVAGVIALMLEANPNLTPQEVKDILHATAEMPEGIEPSTEYDDVYNYAYGWGFIDAYKAVRMAQEGDITPPIISNVELIDVSDSTATISWMTNKPCNSIIEYGETTGLGSVKEDLDTYEISHSMTLDGLTPDTDYYYNIKAYDDNGFGPGESGILGPFHTDDQADTTPPVFIDGPYILGAPDDTSATIFWETDEVSDSVVEYGIDAGYGNFKSDLDDVFDHTLTLTNLAPSTEYYYRVLSTDPSGNTAESPGYSFQTLPPQDTEPPEVTSGPDVTDITHDSATVIWETPHEASTSTVRWGKSLSYDDGDLFNGIYDVYHIMKIDDLDASTKYYYQIESADEAGNSVIIGDDGNYFTTLAIPDTAKPIISNLEITIVTDTTATFQWETDEESTSWVEIEGVVPPVGNNNYVLEHNITFAGLSPSTKYYYQVKSVDRSSNEAFSEGSFITLELVDNIAPSILTGPSVWAIGETSATIVWTTNEDSDSVVNFGTSTGYGATKSDASLMKSHQLILTDLTPATTYHFKVASTDDAGNTNESGDSVFDTLDLTAPIEIKFQNLNSGDTLSGVVTIRGTVTGGIGNIKSVNYKVDDEGWRSIGSGTNFNILLDTSKYTEGEHTLTVEAKVGEMTMQDEISFVVEHEQEDPEDAMMWLLLLGAMFVVLILIIVAVIGMRSKRKAQPSETAYMGSGYYEEPPQFMGDYDSPGSNGLGFIPDDEPEPSFNTDDLSFMPDEPSSDPGISFMPDDFSADSEVSYMPDDFGQEPEIKFTPDSEPVLFNISEEPSYHGNNAVKCPQCQTIFEADTSSDIFCPHCGFSASLRK
jgi:serine protease AprX